MEGKRNKALFISPLNAYFYQYLKQHLSLFLLFRVDLEAVRLGAEFPEPGRRYPEEGDQDLEADGLLGRRNLLHLVLRTVRRVPGGFHVKT